MMPKNQPINEQKHAVSAASVGLYANRTLQNWVPGLQVLNSFLSKGSTWYVYLKVLAICVKQHSLSS